MGIKLMMPLGERAFSLLNEEATKRDVSVQELLRAVIVPEWVRTKDRADYRTSIPMDHGKGVLLMSIDVLHSVEDLLVKTFGRPTAANLLYETGKEAGRRYRPLVDKASLISGSRRRNRRVREDLAHLWGWGRVKAMEFDFEKKLVRSHCANSFYVRSKGKTPVCHFGRGLAAGTVGAILGGQSESIEIDCEGKGDSCCALLTGSPGEIVRLAERRSGGKTN